MKDDGDACQRCEDAPATSHIKLGANNDDPLYSRWDLCDDCTRSLGEWYDE